MIDAFLKRLTSWASDKPDVQAIVLLGSQARGTARADSDIDLVIICSEPGRYLADYRWLNTFNKTTKVTRESWGLVQSWRVHYIDGLEVEFGITTREWCSLPAIASGTGRVISDGAKIVVDPHELLATLIADVSVWKDAMSSGMETANNPKAGTERQSRKLDI